MKSTVTSATLGILSCVSALCAAGCGATPDDQEDTTASATSAVITGRYAYSFKAAPFSWYSQANASFTVPPNPDGSHNQTLYYYVGLWNSSSMTSGITAQLRYNGGTWKIRVCSGTGSNCSTAQTVYPGDSIYAHMNETGCNGSGVCSWVAFVEDWTNFAATSASYTPGVAFKFATPWVEQVSNLTACSDLPATDPIAATSALYKGAAHNPDMGGWSTKVSSSTNPDCDPNVLVDTDGRTAIYQTPWP